MGFRSVLTAQTFEPVVFVKANEFLSIPTIRCFAKGCQKEVYHSLFWPAGKQFTSREALCQRVIQNNVNQLQDLAQV